MHKENIKVKCPSCGEVMRHYVEVPKDTVSDRELTLEQYRQGYADFTYDTHWLTSHVFWCKCGRIDEVSK